LVLDIADHNGCNPLAVELSDKIARADVPKLLSACAPEAGIAEDGHRQSPGRVLGEIPVDYLVRLEICLNEGTTVLPLPQEGGQPMRGHASIQRPRRSDHGLAASIQDLLGKPVFAAGCLSVRPPLQTNRITTSTFLSAPARSAAVTFNIPSSETS
jgi:hypothetical protein